MIELRLWLLRVIVTSIVLSLVSVLMPKGKWETAGNISAGLILLTVMLQPLTGVEFRSTLSSFDEQENIIADTAQDYVQHHYNKWSAVISEKTGAYIQEKGATLGLACRPRVICTENDGVPFPAEVWLDIPFHKELSIQIEKELAIDAAHQHWQEENT